jgi:hypothetical protein
MGQSALLKFLRIINAPVARCPHDTARHVLMSRFEPGCMLGENEEAEPKGSDLAAFCRSPRGCAMA